MNSFLGMESHFSFIGTFSNKYTLLIDNAKIGYDWLFLVNTGRSQMSSFIFPGYQSQHGDIIIMICFCSHATELFSFRQQKLSHRNRKENVSRRVIMVCGLSAAGE